MGCVVFTAVAEMAQTAEACITLSASSGQALEVYEVFEVQYSLAHSEMISSLKCLECVTSSTPWHKITDYSTPCCICFCLFRVRDNGRYVEMHAPAV
jgi:hypothetical protein